MEYGALVLGAGHLGLGLWALWRLWGRGQSGRLLGLGLLAWTLGDLCLALAPALKTLGLELPPLWQRLGTLAELPLETLSWFLLYLGWERAWSREVRDGLLFWSLCGAALLRLLLGAAWGRELLLSAPSPAKTAALALPLGILAACNTAAWHSVRLRARGLKPLWWLLGLRLLALLLAAGLSPQLDPVLLRTPVRMIDIAVTLCLTRKA